MDDFVLAVSVPLALFSITLVIGFIGVGKALAQTPKEKTIWIAFIGSESLIALSYYLRELWLPIDFWQFLQFLFCLFSIGMLVFGLLHMVYEKHRA